MPKLEDHFANFPVSLRPSPPAAPLPRSKSFMKFALEKVTKAGKDLRDSIQKFPEGAFEYGFEGCKGGIYEDLDGYAFIMKMEEGC